MGRGLVIDADCILYDDIDELAQLASQLSPMYKLCVRRLRY